MKLIALPVVVAIAAAAIQAFSPAYIYNPHAGNYSSFMQHFGNFGPPPPPPYGSWRPWNSSIWGGHRYPPFTRIARYVSNAANGNCTFHNATPCYGGHHLLLGCPRYPIDRLLFSKTYTKPGRFWTTREKVIRYPVSAQSGVVSDYVITAIDIYDHLCNGTGGYASLVSGGVNQRNVTIRLYSTEWRKGFSFLVQIFGRFATW